MTTISSSSFREIAYNLNYRLTSIFVEHINGDEYPDIVVAGNPMTSPQQTKIAILLNNGDGTFYSSNNYTLSYNGYDCTYSVFVKDINNDGHNDIAVANDCESAFSILTGNNDGTFNAPSIYTLFTDSTKVLNVFLEDLNKDNYPDLVATYDDSVNAISVAFNDHGDFHDYRESDLYHTSDPLSNSAFVKDINHDTYPDIAITNQNLHSVSVFINNRNNTFTGPTDYPTSSYSPYPIFIADLDHDGNEDIVTGDLNGGAISILQGTNGAFVGYSISSIPSATNALVVHDINGDGKLDIITGNGDAHHQVSIFIGNGDITFQAEQTYNSNSFSYAVQSIFIKDVNHDNKPDIIIASYTYIGIFLNNISEYLPACAYVDSTSRIFAISCELAEVISGGDATDIKNNVLKHLTSYEFLRLDPGHQVGVLQDIAGQTFGLSIDYSDTTMLQGLQDALNELQQLI